ncbi:bifunctional pyr operon transcriptional regulator/uracil phosphoribosyltransferase PyrR [Tepidimonas taiwanensis]|uniref:Bifunctional protein PyrR n=1 Tax=Tepidimonas taiwanensis TaxID=307486 RepID=A0A554X1A3_9BURK|nr:bifunctional pyr operon transcriptional regulator/uracil phosphoribosyltransferase PyrR [Tepidimonas taiwanensis]MDM7464248.1 bifunctional pyr operon transcriptional regulator/uracil phosphoribosyltransferase PyrR [Tepidimonas taiwanensis]TSE29603.1 Bifunctional protein PyrR [Tepidimonas taiwanensis]UBQ04809.1 bifunctional pyr operon transcriptional regulator/uracil phosphoribosyltransferase PyrR [Tepidimonas taiwanensis]
MTADAEPARAAAAAPLAAGTLPIDAEALYAELRRAVQALLATGPQPTHLVGVVSGGAWLAARLHRELGLPGEPGTIAATLHRDDYAQRGLAAAPAQTRLPFAVEGAHVLLIDDVLYTGRTLRAVLNELFDYGRPASVRLAVLVDRGGRELPVAADAAAVRLPLPPHQSFELAQGADGRFSFVLLERAQPRQG